MRWESRPGQALLIAHASALGHALGGNGKRNWKAGPAERFGTTEGMGLPARKRERAFRCSGVLSRHH
jgi:hypothetical protein